MFMFIIDASAQNAYSLFKLQSSKSNDILRERQNQLEILAFELIKYNVKTRYENAVNDRFSGRRLTLIKKFENFLKAVNLF